LHSLASGSTGDTVRVDDTMYHHIFKAYTQLSKVIGTVNDAFGQFVINPRSAADVDSVGIAVGVGAGPVATEFAIRSITPNPVSFARGTATIHFNLPTAGKVTARIYDVNGRLVAEPAKDVALNAGAQTILLDGSQLSRHASGIFFVELRLGNKVATGKLTVTQ
jgi:type IX secretion system substrate protein